MPVSTISPVKKLTNRVTTDPVSNHFTPTPLPAIPVGQPIAKGSVEPASILATLNANVKQHIPVARAVRPALIRGGVYGDMRGNSISLEYQHMAEPDLSEILAKTPKPKGKTEWSSLHIIHCRDSPYMDLVKVRDKGFT